MTKTAIVVGATGLVGKELVTQLCGNDSYKQVICLVRQPLEFEHHKLSQHRVDFSQMDELKALIKGDDMYCALGTTIKAAGSKQTQQQIDLTLPLTIAQCAKSNGITGFALVSSAGAKSDSSSFYLSLKGQLEQGLIALNFDKLTIVRPSVLTGKRPDFRFAEGLSIQVLNLLQWLPWLRSYRPISAAQVAKSLVHYHLNNSASLVIKQLNQLHQLT